MSPTVLLLDRRSPLSFVLYTILQYIVATATWPARYIYFNLFPIGWKQVTWRDCQLVIGHYLNLYTSIYLYIIYILRSSIMPLLQQPIGHDSWCHVTSAWHVLLCLGPCVLCTFGWPCPMLYCSVRLLHRQTI